MKSLMILITLVLSLLIITTSCDKDSEPSVSPSTEYVIICEKEHKIYSQIYERCNNSKEGVMEMLCNDTLKEFFTITMTEDQYVHDQYKTCLNNLYELSCDEINAIKTKDDFRNIEGCLVYEDIKKIETCDRNIANYCQSLLNTCGKDSLYGICSANYYEYVDDEGRDKKSFKYEKLRTYCNEATNKDESADFTDLFIRTCKDYTPICSSVVEFDFRNDDWKTQCVQ